MDYTSKKSYLYLIFIIIITSLIFYTPFTHMDIMLDYEIIIKPLLNITSISEYFLEIKSGKVHDFQPVRDFSHIIDIYLVDLSGFKKIPLIHNIILFFITSLVLFKIFLIYFNRKISFYLINVFMLHPLVFHIYVAITNRKHILSFLFFLLSYLYFLRDKKSTKSNFYYFLSLFSQPINALAPLFFLFHNKLDRSNFKNLVRIILPYTVIFTLGAVLNLYYYEIFHYKKIGLGGMQYQFVLSDILNSISIHFRQFFWPTSFSTYYTFDKINILITMMLTPFFLLVVYKGNKTLSKKLFILLFSIFFMLYGHKSNVLSVLIQNSYILTPTFVFIMFLGIIYKKHDGFFKYTSIPILIVLGILTLQFSTYRTNKYDYYKRVLQKEPHCRVLQFVVEDAILQGKRKDVTSYGMTWLNEKCNIVGKNLGYRKAFINTHLIYLSPEFKSSEKVALFIKKFPERRDYVQILSSLFIETQESNPLNAERINQLLLQLKDIHYASIFTIKSFFNASIKNYCSKKSSSGCLEYKSYLKRIKGKDMIINFKKNTE